MRCGALNAARTKINNDENDKSVFVEDNAFLGFRGGQSGWLLPTLATMSRGLRVLANEVWWCSMRQGGVLRGAVWYRVFGVSSTKTRKSRLTCFIPLLVLFAYTTGVGENRRVLFLREKLEIPRIHSRELNQIELFMGRPVRVTLFVLPLYVSMHLMLVHVQQ